MHKSHQKASHIVSTQIVFREIVSQCKFKFWFGKMCDQKVKEHSKENLDRGNWASKTEFLLSCLG